MDLKFGCFSYAVCVIIMCWASYLITAELLYLIMWGLTTLGVVLPIAWSWDLSAVVWLILVLLNITIKKQGGPYNGN